jgi:phage host-nuclease inhibitor protein Gam
MPSKKIKAPASAYVPQTRDECAADIRRLGDLQRQQTRLAADMSDRIAAIQAEYQPRIDALKPEVERLAKGVQAWCEAHRAELTEGFRVKTATFITGAVTWRVQMPSCKVTGQEAVITLLKSVGLGHYVRTSEAVDKESVINTTMAARTVTAEEAAQDPAKARTLADARALAHVAGLPVVTGVEAFTVEPSDQEATA